MIYSNEREILSSQFSRQDRIVPCSKFWITVRIMQAKTECLSQAHCREEPYTNVYILSYTEIKTNTVGFGGGWGLPGIEKKKVKSQGRP